MESLPTSRIALWSALLAVVVILSAVVWGRGPGHALVDWTGRVAAPVAVRANAMFALAHAYLGGHDLATENLNLRHELEGAQAAAAQVDDLRRENEFLRGAAGVRQRLTHEPIAGAVFAYSMDGGGRQVMLNRGSADGVAVGDIVSTSIGGMVGVVVSVFDRHALVRSLGDPALDVAVRVVGTEVTGLVRTDPIRGLIIDLVQKAEEVTEGQSIVTSGNDQFPAGLVVGTIASVDNDSATLFKIVRVSPALKVGWDGRVLIIRP